MQNLADLRPVVPPCAPDIRRLTTAEAVIVHCRLPAWEAGEYVSRSSPASIGVSFTAQACVIESSGRRQERTIEADGVVITGAEPPSWLKVDRPCELIEVSAGSAFRAALADELGVARAFDLADLSLGSDPVVWAIGAQLRAGLRGRVLLNEVAIEALVRRLYGHVFIQHFGGLLRNRGSGALDPRRLARVTDYIESHLADRLSLSDLANVAALSPFHFQRSFRIATGCSPHRYIALKRAERAAQRIAQGRPAPEVATTLRYGSARRLRAAAGELLGRP